MKRFTAISQGLNNARAYKHSSAEHHAKLQAGAAERCCTEATHILEDCSNAAENDASWRTLIQEELKAVETRRSVAADDTHLDKLLSQH